MSTALRLYREIASIDPNRPVDIRQIDREKRDVLVDLDVYRLESKDIEKRPIKFVQRNKNHGKIARAKSLRKDVKEVHQLVDCKRHVETSIVAVDKINNIMRKFGDQLKDGIISNKFMKSIDIHHSTTELPSIAAQNQPSPSKLYVFDPTSVVSSPPKGNSTSLHRSAATSSLDRPITSYTRCSVSMKPRHEDIVLNQKEKATILPTLSRNRWPPDEIDYFNEIFRSLVKPPSNDAAYWTTYFDSFCIRYRKLYPTRSKAEIINRIKISIKKNTLKVSGEELFWSNVKK